MDPFQEYQAGHLNNAVEAITEVVKKQPLELSPRTFLFELLCFQGDWERAGRQLDMIAHQHGESDWGAQVYKNLILAEQARRQTLNGNERPDTFLDPPAYMEDHLAAVAAAAAGDHDKARGLLEKVDQQRPTVTADRNGESLQPFQDCDDLLAPVLELFIISDYVWVPWEQIVELEVNKPERPRDLIWAPIRVQLVDETQRRGYVPVLYPGTAAHDDDQVKLGRLTDWVGPQEGPIRGVGHKMLLAGEEGLPFLETGTVTFSVDG